MTDPMIPATREQRELLAAEFALGLLEGSAFETAMNLFEHDADFASLVGRYELGLADQAGAQPEVPRADPAFWQRIERSLDSIAEPVAPPAAANDDQPGPWRTAAVAALASAAMFALLWVAVPGVMPQRAAVAAPDPAISIAQIGTADGPITAVAYDRRNGKLLARFVPQETQGRVPVLWLIGSDGKPRSLGSASPGEAITLVIPAELRAQLVGGATIAISLEKPSETRYEAPAGPILGTAKVSEI